MTRETAQAKIKKITKLRKLESEGEEEYEEECSGEDCRHAGVREGKKKVLATTYFPTSGLAVSLALEVLTSEFGMESGVAPPPWSPGRNM